MTPASLISWYKSLPSRVRSPTPAKTEKPPWVFAMLLMSSRMTTVLPTPAPPKAPALPPLMNGQMRSMTLMPVSRIWALVSWSTSAGAGRWIGYLLSKVTGPRLSTGWPVTSKMRPRTPAPTGTEMGAPVSVTDIPRFRPSTDDIAIARAIPPPRCCWISSVRSSFLPATVKSMVSAW